MLQRMLYLLPFDQNESTSGAIVKLGVWMAAIMAPLYDVLGAVMLLIILDFLTGVGAAFKLKEGIQASKVRNTVNKFLFYSLVLLAAHVVEVKITPALPWLNIVSGFVALTELRSIFENFNRIFGLNIWDYVKAIIKQIKAGSQILDELSRSDKDQDQEENEPQK